MRTLLAIALGLVPVVLSCVVLWRWRAAREKAAAGILQGRQGKLGVGGEGIGIADRAVRGNPIGFGHRRSFTVHGS